MIEQGVIFTSHDKQLVAIEHLPDLAEQPQSQNKKGMLIVVGGPQTRVGSHRLFVFLARALAKQGITVFRFDYSGAGDSEGEISDFTNIQTDIDAAINTFQERHCDIEEISLWGLCDAASAILLYLSERPQQAKVKQLFLVNPWVRQTQTQAQAYLRFYYIKRLLSRSFWQKFLSGKVATKTAFSDIRNFHKQGKVSNRVHTNENFVTQMLEGLAEFTGQVDIILSGNDLTADEFKSLIKTNKDWLKIMSRETVRQANISQTDHTFSQYEKKTHLLKLVCHAFEN